MHSSAVSFVSPYHVSRAAGDWTVTDQAFESLIPLITIVDVAEDFYFLSTIKKNVNQQFFSIEKIIRLEF